MTQAELGMAIGVAQNTISAYETGEIDLHCDQIIRIEFALGLRLGTLLIESGFIDDSLLGLDAARLVAIGKLNEALSTLTSGNG